MIDHQTYVKYFFKKNRLNTILTILAYIGISLLNVLVSWYLQVIFDVMSQDSSFTFVQLLYFCMAILIAISLIYFLQYWFFPHFLEKAMT